MGGFSLGMMGGENPRMKTGGVRGPFGGDVAMKGQGGFQALAEPTVAAPPRPQPAPTPAPSQAPAYNPQQFLSSMGSAGGGPNPYAPPQAAVQPAQKMMPGGVPPPAARAMRRPPPMPARAGRPSPYAPVRPRPENSAARMAARGMSNQLMLGRR